MLEQYGSDRRIVVERTATEAPDLAQALVRVARALTEHALATREWRAGEPPGRPIELTDQNLQTYLSEVHQAQAAGEPAFVALLSGKLAVILNGEQTPAGALSSVTVTLPPDRQDHEQVSALLNDVVTAFGAFHGQVEENRLFLVYHSQRAAERAWAATPQEYRQYLPGPEPLPPTPIPGLLVPQEYDRRLVPTGIWWINFWDREQVQTLDRERVEKADWADRQDHPEGGMTLVATREPFDVDRPDHAAHLAHLLADLHLRDQQQHHRYPE